MSDCIERLADLVDIAPEPTLIVEPGAAGWFVRQRKRDHTASMCQRIDGRLHPLPSTLHAGDYDDRRSAAAVNDFHPKV